MFQVFQFSDINGVLKVRPQKRIDRRKVFSWSEVVSPISFGGECKLQINTIDEVVARSTILLKEF